MALGSIRTVVTYCRSLFRGQGAGETDGCLLQRYATERDAAAFEQLLERHGAMVLGVCRRVLRDAHKAEDAFQATFLVLVRRAAALDRQANVAGWLHTVAYRIALKLKASAGPPAACAVHLSEGVVAGGDCNPADEAARRELRPILDEELSGLPEKYRAPLVLCYLQGKTNEEAARLLGWPVGTVSGRMARARALLGKRLARRGVALGAAPAAAAAVPRALAHSTAALLANPPVGTAVTTLAAETARRIAWAHVKKVAALALVVGVILSAAAALILPQLLREADPPQPPAVQAAAAVEEAEALPAVVVRAVYPGASARDVAEKVAAPIEAALQDIEGCKHMTSVSDNDGSYTLTLAFAAATDHDRAVTLVQKRLALADAVLPEEVRRGGILVKKKPGEVLLFVVLQSDGKYDTLYLSNYATIFVEKGLRGVAGVGAVELLGYKDYSMRLSLDPAKLADRGLKAADVIRTLKKQFPAGAPAIGKPRAPGEEFSYPLTTQSRLEDAAQFQDIVLKVGKDGVKTRVSDVGEIGTNAGVRYNGKPAVALSVAPAAGCKTADVGPAVRSALAKLAEAAPAGMRLEAIFDASRNEKALRVDVTLMDGASQERTLGTLEKGERLLSAMGGVGPALVLSGHPFHLSNQGRLLVGLTPAGAAQRERVAAAIRDRLKKELSAALIQIADLDRPRRLASDGYDVVLAVQGGDDPKTLRAAAAALADRLRRSGKFTDVGLGPGSGEDPKMNVEIDRDMALARGVALSEIYDALGVYLGSSYVNNFHAFGRNWQVIVQAAPEGPRARVEDLADVRVPNSKGEMVALGTMIRERPISSPATVQRFNGRPMIAVTANLAPGVSAAEARTFCATAAREELPVGFDLGWLDDQAAR